MKTIAFHNLGCKVNSYEVEVMQQNALKNGYEIVQFTQKADIYVVNTCTVTNIADRKSRQMLHRAKELNPDAIVVAVGCYVQTGREQLEKDSAVDLLIGNNHKSELISILEEYMEQAAVSDEKKEAITVAEDLVEPCDYEDMMLSGSTEHTRAYIKIQDGCNQFCSYCAIPLARGRIRSRAAEDIVTEIRGLVEKGFQEVVLTGIHISSYGLDFEKKHYEGESHLVELVEAIDRAPGMEGLKRIRLGSLEPRVVTEDTAKRLAAISRLCPHFHLSLQSGCDETLKRMNRHYTAAEFEESVGYLRKYFDEPGITTDVIVGFPGETQAEFQESRDFLEKICFYEMHIFKYSKRDNTRAAKMPNQVPDAQKTQRSDELLAMEKEQSKSFRSKYLGKTVEVLWEEEKTISGKHVFLGHTTRYVKVAIPVKEALAHQRTWENTCSRVRIADFLTDEVLLGLPE